MKILYTFLEEMSINKMENLEVSVWFMKRKSVFIILKIKREDKICLLYMKILYGIKAKVTGFTLFVKM